ncbi:ketosteroid isomerase-related protein [Sphingobium baderi]|uniref:ketosteroid isomerase-related protein n=1 Tax=Sphingobium baderi TaxID=1332080 RepID=UPI002B411C29|nr:ketosteroid isomerase-related protein [Sphingobium baderi]WRD77085.1 ketosteroid isomerase-related protein [Sphingobium baderi]
MSETLLSRYYEAFNRGDAEAMLGLLTEDVVHEPSQGEPRQGKTAFAAFLDHMNRCYKERVIDPVFLSSGDGTRAAAEFQLEGEYLQTDSDLPPARGQRYRLRVGAFFDIVDGRIARVSNHYNLADWLRQVGEPA